MDDQLRAELLRRAEQDQHARTADPALISQVDANNLAWLQPIIRERGWPTRSMVGEEASGAAWLLVQHADQDPAFQRYCLTLLTDAAAEQEASLREVAYLTDRVLLAEGRMQEFGTQVVERDGRFAPREMRAPESVDERRAAMGLEPLDEYLTWF